MAKFNPESMYHSILLKENVRKFGEKEGMARTVAGLRNINYVPSANYLYSRVNKKPRVMKTKVCQLCGEDFIVLGGRQMYCSTNSQGERCGYIIKLRQLYTRRSNKNESKISDRKGKAVRELVLRPA